MDVCHLGMKKILANKKKYFHVKLYLSKLQLNNAATSTILRLELKRYIL